MTAYDEWPTRDTDYGPTLTHEDCLSYRGADDTCEGAVEYRMALSSSGRSFPRCDKHWEERLKEQEEINERYPSHQPSDFDPTYAGERWYEEY